MNWVCIPASICFWQSWPMIPYDPVCKKRSCGQRAPTETQWAIAMAIQNNARVAAMSGDWAEAYMGFEEASALFQKMRDRPFYNASRSEIGHIYRKQGRHHEAATIYSETIRASRAGQFAAVAHELECFAFIAIAQSQAQGRRGFWGCRKPARRINSSMRAWSKDEYDQELSALPSGRWTNLLLRLAWARART